MVGWPSEAGQYFARVYSSCGCQSKLPPREMKALLPFLHPTPHNYNNVKHVLPTTSRKYAIYADRSEGRL